MTWRRRLRRVLRFAAWGVALLVIPGALFISAAVFAATATIPAVDPKWRPSAKVLLWARVWALAYRVPWATMVLPILHNEGASTGRPPTDAEARALVSLGLPGGLPDGAEVYPLGDVGIANGPSVGPGQVERVNVLRLAGRADRALLGIETEPASLALVGHERSALWYAVVVMREKLLAAQGDVGQGIRRYNGSGPAADAYETRAEQFSQTYTDESAALDPLKGGQS